MFVDTNVVLRWILDDHAVQSRQVFSLIQSSKNNNLVITDVVLAEVYYVLRGKQLDNQQIASIFDSLLEEPSFGFDSDTLFTRQVEVIRSTNLDFADCYLIARALYARQPLKTFDKPMQRAYDKYKKQATKEA